MLSDPLTLSKYTQVITPRPIPGRNQTRGKYSEQMCNFSVGVHYYNRGTRSLIYSKQYLPTILLAKL